MVIITENPKWEVYDRAGGILIGVLDEFPFFIPVWSETGIDAMEKGYSIKWIIDKRYVYRREDAD